MQGVGIHTSGKNLAGCGLYRIECPGQTCYRIKEDNHIVSALNQPLGLLKNYTGHFHMSLRRLIESRGNHFSLHAAGHIRNFLRALVYKKDNHIHLGMIVSNGVRNILQQDGFSCLRLGHDQTALALSYGSEQVYYAA